MIPTPLPPANVHPAACAVEAEQAAPPEPAATGLVPEFSSNVEDAAALRPVSEQLPKNDTLAESAAITILESNACDNPQGEGVTAEIIVTRSIAERCSHANRGGARCKMPASPGSPLCTYHKHRAEAAQSSSDTAGELLRSVRNFRSAARVNRFLGNVVRQAACGRINRQDAAALGYLGQVLLKSLEAMEQERKRERERHPMVPLFNY